MIVQGVFVVSVLLLGAWLAPTTRNSIFFVIVFVGGTLLHTAMSKRLSHAGSGILFYSVVTASASFVIPFFDALIIGIAGLIFDPFNIMRDNEEKPT